MRLIVHNVIWGKVVSDPLELEKALGLDATGNLMINAGMVFPGSEPSKMPGYQLPICMQQLKMAWLERATLPQFIKRMLFLNGFGKSPIPFKEPSDLVPVIERLQKWFDKGWLLEVGTLELKEEEFYSFVIWRECESIQQSFLSLLRQVEEQLAKFKL